MNRAGKWAVGILLTAAAAAGALQTVSAPTQTEMPSAQQNEACGYQWAYSPAPQLSEAFDAEVKSMDPEASGRVEYFGEDCVHPDGTSDFLTKETDFYFRLKVNDLKQEEEFGNWVVKVMEYVTQIPREDLPGSYGFVEFWFEETESEHIAFRVPIQNYINEAQGKNGAELFQMFYNPP